MKKIVGLLLGLLVIAGLSGRLSAEYLDVGDDPERLQIASTVQIAVPVDYEFKGWSPDGEFFAFARSMNYTAKGGLDISKPDRTVIYSKAGQAVKTIDGALVFWMPDSNSVLVTETIRNLYLYNLKTNSKKMIYIFFDEPDEIKCLIPETGELIYRKSHDINKYNFNTDKSELIYKSQNLTGFNIQSITKDDLILICRKLENDGYDYLYKYNIPTKKLSKFFPEPILSDVYLFRTRTNKLIIYFDGNVCKYFIDEKGNTIFKFSSAVFKTPKRYEEFSTYANIDYLSFAPNGRIFASTVGKFDDEVSSILSSDIYLINQSGKMKRLTDTPDKKELVLGWSPQGNKLIYCDSNKYDVYYNQIYTKYYMIHLIKN